jgi:hypothetical protein
MNARSSRLARILDNVTRILDNVSETMYLYN